MPEPHPKLRERLETASFRPVKDQPLVFMRKLDLTDEKGNKIIAWVDFRKRESGERAFSYEHDISNWTYEKDEVNKIEVLKAYKEARDALMNGKLTNYPKKTESVQPAQSSQDLDKNIELAKAKRFLEDRGSSYKVQGKERPDSHMIQNVANLRGISIELIEATQNDNYAHVVVRAHLGDQFVDAVVHHNFATEYLLKSMEIIKKNPEILDHYEGTTPVIKDGAKIKTEDGKIADAKYYLVHTLLSFKKFSLRDARTKAASIAEAMLLNRDWREADEVQSELSEKTLVEAKQ